MEDRILEQIKQKNVNVNSFAELAIENEIVRDIIIKNILQNKNIMIYYHCYYILDKATQLNPGVFYKYFTDFSELLHHKNSYHRDIGLTLVANLVSIDEENKFTDIQHDYLSLTNDKKFMTGNCCVKNLAKIIVYRKDLTDVIIETLLTLDHSTHYKPKQLELLKYDILNILTIVMEEYKDKNRLISFIKESQNSISPKTRKRARELIEGLKS